LRLFVFGKFCDNYNNSTNFWGQLLTENLYDYIRQNSVLSTFWAFFSQKLVATLLTDKVCQQQNIFLLASF
jgi:hypothetical protein